MPETCGEGLESPREVWGKELSISVLIRGGRIVTASDDFVADVYAEGETVSLIGESLAVEAEKVIDARGKYVLPGCVDPHTHFAMPLGDLVTIDDFVSGQTSAAFGGTTCHVDFPTQERGQSFTDALAGYHARVGGQALIDYGFHMIVTDLGSPELAEELSALPEQGVSSYKLLMAYRGRMVDDATLFEVMRIAAASGGLVMVHGENGPVIDLLVQRALAEGRREPRWHALTRPAALEGEATNRAIQIAHVAECPLYVVHVSCVEAVEPIETARSRGWPVWGETCPQYLLIDESFLERPDFEGAKYVFSPPPRDRSVIGTDHCAYLFDGQKTRGLDDFSKIPGGAPGVEDRLLLIHHFGVNEGRISLSRMVELLATSPARLFGLYPRKGTVAVGSDADLVVFDPALERTISARTHHSRADYNLYEGTTVVGAPTTVLLRGRLLIEGGKLIASPGVGRFVARARFGDELGPRAS
jgi:dihydropyrimidinase